MAVYHPSDRRLVYLQSSSRIMFIFDHSRLLLMLLLNSLKINLERTCRVYSYSFLQQTFFTLKPANLMYASQNHDVRLEMIVLILGFIGTHKSGKRGCEIPSNISAWGNLVYFTNRPKFGEIHTSIYICHEGSAVRSEVVMIL